MFRFVSFLFVTPSGIEPLPTEPKSVVLPLYDGALNARLDICLRYNEP